MKITVINHNAKYQTKPGYTLLPNAAIRRTRPSPYAMATVAILCSLPQKSEMTPQDRELLSNPNRNGDGSPGGWLSIAELCSLGLAHATCSLGEEMVIELMDLTDGQEIDWEAGEEA